MKPKNIIIMIVYIILVYTTVNVFATGNIEVTYPNYIKSSDIEDKGNLSQENITWFDSIGLFFGSIVKAFSYIIGLFSFNLIGDAGLDIPPQIGFITFMMVLPVWIILVYWIAPYVIKALNAIGNWIPFT